VFIVIQKPNSNNKVFLSSYLIENFRCDWQNCVKYVVIYYKFKEIFFHQSVIDAKDVRQFEIRLDKYWEHQDVKFEYKASIQNKENTGNHTEISCIKEVEVDIVAESQRPQMT
jgi:hypothetical protein